MSLTPTIQGALPASKFPLVSRFPLPRIKETLSILTSPISPPISNKTLALGAPKPDALNVNAKVVLVGDI